MAARHVGWYENIINRRQRLILGKIFQGMFPKWVQISGNHTLAEMQNRGKWLWD